MYNRNQNQRQNPQDFPIFVDNTSTPAGVVYPTNANIPATLHVIAGNQQREQRPNDPHPGAQPLHMHYWWVQNTLPNDPTTSNALYAQNPQALVTAQNTQYPPQGAPVAVLSRPWGYQVEGEWHIAYWNQQLQQRQQRVNPDINPHWSTHNLQARDEVYRNQPIIIPGTIWPSPAIGMTTYQPTLIALENAGIHIADVDRNGYVQWYWQGRQ